MICRLKTKLTRVGLKVHQIMRPVMTEAEQLMLLPLQGAFLFHLLKLLPIVITTSQPDNIPN